MCRITEHLERDVIYCQRTATGVWLSPHCSPLVGNCLTYLCSCTYALVQHFEWSVQRLGLSRCWSLSNVDQYRNRSVDCIKCSQVSAVVRGDVAPAMSTTKQRCNHFADTPNALCWATLTHSESHTARAQSCLHRS